MKMFLVTTHGLALMLLVGFAIDGAAQTGAQKQDARKQDFKKDDAIARAAIDSFIKATANRDLEGIMKLVDVPFYFIDKDRIIRDKDRLRKAFSDGFQDKEDRNEPRTVPDYRVLKMGSLPELVKENPKLSESFLPQVLGEGDRVALVTMGQGKNEIECLFGIRVKNGKGIVVAD